MNSAIHSKLDSIFFCVLGFSFFLNRASVWIDPYQKPHQVSKVNSLWPIKVNVVKGSRQNRLVSSVEGLAL